MYDKIRELIHIGQRKEIVDFQAFSARLLSYFALNARFGRLSRINEAARQVQSAHRRGQGTPHGEQLLAFVENNRRRSASCVGVIGKSAIGAALCALVVHLKLRRTATRAMQKARQGVIFRHLLTSCLVVNQRSQAIFIQKFAR